MIADENNNSATQATGNPFAGRTIVVTGKLANFTRESINAMIETLGAEVGSAVSKNTGYLIANWIKRVRWVLRS